MNKFAYSLKEQQVSPRKVFAIDTGLRNVMSFKFSQDLGKIYENVVFLELQRKRTQNHYMEIYYWKDEKQHEVDFVIKEKKTVHQLIQVCWDLSDFKTKEREVKSLLKASNELNCNNLLIINSEYEGEEKEKGVKIKISPLWKWLSSF